MHRTRLAALAAAVAALIAGCESAEKNDKGATTTSMGMLNSTCPMSGEPVDPSSSAEYHGHKIGFCCDGCIASWEKKSEAEKEKYVSAQMHH